MYRMREYLVDDENQIKAFIEAHPLAMITGVDAQNRPVATQVPVLVEKRGDKFVLIGHIMRNTDHHRAFVQNPNVLAVFTGANTYVSATWYTNPNMGSTWNYMSVYARGVIKLLDGEALNKIMQTMTLHFEGGNEHSATVFKNLSDEYREHMTKAIAGFEIEVSQIDGLFKLSQDRDAESHANIIGKLEKLGDSSEAVAAAMKEKL